MDPGEQTTGTRDEHYDLISVLYHALQGTETIEAYILDAEAAGDERLADFFREERATYKQLAERAKGLLGMESTAPEVDGVPPGAASTEIDVPSRSMGTQTEGEIPPVAATPGEDVTPPEEVVPPDTPSPPNEERPPRSGSSPPS